MKSEIQSRRKANEERFVNSPRHTIQCDVITTMDDIYQEIGATPKMNFKDLIAGQKAREMIFELSFSSSKAINK
ncbi:hypothetical protein CEXT_258371 [Caerostris extrusa]|uniref:Flavin-containing monooxygenase n=1 Tax=Caerostris extrusa TaxID=172846 RepID=A0AAV4TTV0_CAEEX|nr:hypothetical protein CEXT_258371 [Caerostris extrusa]